MRERAQVDSGLGATLHRRLPAARKWFTRAMKLRVKPLGLHILDDPVYRL